MNNEQEMMNEEVWRLVHSKPLLVFTSTFDIPCSLFIILPMQYPVSNIQRSGSRLSTTDYRLSTLNYLLHFVHRTKQINLFCFYFCAFISFSKLLPTLKDPSIADAEQAI
jgi:hypothetical protein